MSCKSAIFTVNSSGQTLAENGQVPFGSAVRRYGCNCMLDGGSISLLGSGYYDASVSLTVEPTAEGTITAQLYKDGVAIPGAIATATAAAAGDAVTLPISCLVRNCGCNCNGTLSLMVTAEATLVNCAAVVRKG